MVLLFVVVWMAVVGGWYDRMKRKIPAECSIAVVVSMVDGNWTNWIIDWDLIPVAIPIS